MKNYFIKIFAPFFFPQIVFGKEIAQQLKNEKRNLDIIDVPCGNGETSFHLSCIEKSRVYGYDISSNSIDSAKRNFKKPDLTYVVKDINAALAEHSGADVFCIINSLFLFRDVELVLKNLHSAMNERSKAFIIIPNTNGRNFKWFQIHKPEGNQFFLEKINFDSFFRKRNFAVKQIKGIVYTSSYGKKYLNIFSIFSHILLNIFNLFSGIIKINEPNYYLIHLTKSTKPLSTESR